jgi:hypothetical protein
MTQFLVVFDRQHGHVVEVKEFSNDHDALKARFSTERLHAGDVNIEVVVLGAASQADLRQTHGRYFNTVHQLAQAAAEKVGSFA